MCLSFCLRIHCLLIPEITARAEYPASHVTVSPNRFVLMEKTSCELTFTYQPLQNDAQKCQQGQGKTYTTAHMVIYSGDEVLRKEYRKYVSPRAVLSLHSFRFHFESVKSSFCMPYIFQKLFVSIFFSCLLCGPMPYAERVL